MSLWPGNSAPERSSKNSRDLPMLDQRVSDQLLASEKRTESRLAAIEETLDVIKTRLLDPSAPIGATSSASGGASCRSASPLSASARNPAAPRVSFTEASSSSSSSADDRLGHLGTLTIHIRSASNLIKADFRGLSDPYAVVHLPGQDERRTATIKNTLEPTWEEKLDFDGELSSFLKMELSIGVFDEDFGFFASHMGSHSMHKKKHKPSVSDAQEHLGAHNINTNKDDKLGRVPPISLDFLATQDSKEFDNVTLEDVKSGTISFTISWVQTSDDDDEVRALVERDPEIRSLLKDMRRQMDLNAERAGQDGRGSPLSRARTRALQAGSRNSESANGSSTGTCASVAKFMCGPVLHPDGKFRSVWNILLAFLIIYCAFSVPIEISFEADMVVAMCGYGEDAVPRFECASFLTWFTCNLIVDAFFIIDIIVNFRTGFMQEGHFVDDAKLAAWYYGFSLAFVMDFVGSFPLNLLLLVVESSLETANDESNSAGRINRVLRLIRMTKLFKLTRMIKLVKYMSNFEDFFNPAVLSVVKLMMAMILVSHWFGCMWWLVSDYERTEIDLGTPWYGPENMWMAQDWLVNSPQFSEKYSHSFLWGAGMVTAMVPFDIMPVTVIESWITVGAMFIGLILNAIVISSLTTALSSMYAKKQLAGKQLDTIRNYLVLKSVPNELRSRVLEYYEYFYTSSTSLASSINSDEMPRNLATQLALSMNRKLAARCSFFRDVSNACIVELIQAMQPAIFVPGQNIVFEGQQLTVVYLINRGLVQLLRKAQHITTLRDNENFGFDEYVAAVDEGGQATVRFTARAIGYCDVMELSVERLSESVQADETFREKHSKAVVRAPTTKGPTRARQLRNSVLGLTGRSKAQRVPNNPPGGGTGGKRVTVLEPGESGTAGTSGSKELPDDQPLPDSLNA